MGTSDTLRDAIGSDSEDKDCEEHIFFLSFSVFMHFLELFSDLSIFLFENKSTKA